MSLNTSDPFDARRRMTGSRPDFTPARRAFGASVLTATTALLASCSIWPTAPMDGRVRHVLDARPAVATSTKRDLLLSVRQPRAAPGFGTSAILYVREPHVLDRYATHEWAETPARMLGPLLVRSLEDADGFSAIVQDPNGLPVDLRLDAEIVFLRQNFLTRPSVVEFAMRVQLIDVRNRRMLASRYIEFAERATSDDATGGVAAANAAVARALTQVVSFCVDATADVHPSRQQLR